MESCTAQLWRSDLATGTALTTEPRMTVYRGRMTMLSFRVGEVEARAAQAWAERLGVHRSELLRDALRQHLLRLASERDAATWERIPLSADEQSLDAIADWGPAEDWSDWADATR